MKITNPNFFAFGVEYLLISIWKNDKYGEISEESCAHGCKVPICFTRPDWCICINDNVVANTSQIEHITVFEGLSNVFLGGSDCSIDQDSICSPVEVP